MLRLDARKVRILQAVVRDYVQTTRPVGSERLIEIYHLGCKSATVRNEMAEMAEMGYLLQPHTSAGRIPTDRGYRYYVDELMEPPVTLTLEDAQRAQAQFDPACSEVEEILQQTCRILAALTSYVSIATDPVTETTSVRRIYLTHAGVRHILLIVLLSNGHVEHRLVELEAAPDDDALIPLSNYLTDQIANHSRQEIEHLLRRQEISGLSPSLLPVLAKVVSVLRQVIASLSERRVYLEGANQLLRQPEFHDVQRLENLLNALEQRSALFQALCQTLAGFDVTIRIGSENPFELMQECTVITRSYKIGNRHAGYLGVVGPTRMHYERAIASVNLMASSLSQMLTSLSVA